MRCVRTAGLFVVLVALPEASGKEPDLSSPKATLLSYVEAVKAGDYETARRCWVIDGKDQDGAMEVVVGLWTATRRAQVAVNRKFGKAGTEALGKLSRTDVSDEALDRTLSRVRDSQAEVKGDRASLQVRWKEDDGYPNDAFLFSKEPFQLRKVGETWRLDASALAGEDAESVLKPGTWGPLIRDYARMLNEVAEGVASDKLKSKDDVSRLVDERVKAAARRYEESRKENPIKSPKRP